MPIYEYQCEQCGHRFEKLQRLSADPLQQCPQCHELSLKKLVSAAGFQLLGSGWYATDFKNKNTDSNKASAAGESQVSQNDTTAKPTEKALEKPAKTATSDASSTVKEQSNA